jgi:hypothetical protein
MSKKIKFAFTVDQLVALDLAVYYFSDQLNNGHIALQGSEKEYYQKHAKEVLKLIDVVRGGKSAY